MQKYIDYVNKFQEWNENWIYKVLDVKSIKVDWKKIKENTFYYLRDWEFNEFIK